MGGENEEEEEGVVENCVEKEKAIEIGAKRDYRGREYGGGRKRKSWRIKREKNIRNVEGKENIK